jgi:small subunit ribosomal protein S8
MLTDPIADMLTRIRNGQQASLAIVKAPFSNLKVGILDVLKNNGYIAGYAHGEIRAGVKEIEIKLKYHKGIPVIKEINKVSRPGRRAYTSVDELKVSKFYNGLGIYILSTSKGILSDRDAKVANIGGEILAEVY